MASGDLHPPSPHDSAATAAEGWSAGGEPFARGFIGLARSSGRVALIAAARRLIRLRPRPRRRGIEARAAQPGADRPRHAPMDTFSVSGPGYIGSMQTATTGDGRGASRVFVDTNVLIQPLAAADVPAVRSLLVDLPLSYPGAEAWLERRLQDCLDERARCMIATTPDGVVGVTILTPKALATKLSTIYVRPDFRRSGLGGRLLDQVLRDARGWAPRDAQGETYVTVAHHTWGQLERLLLGRGFTRTAFEPNRYGQGRHEIVATRLG